MFGISGANLRRVELSHTDNKTNGGDGGGSGLYTFTGVLIGAAHTNRQILVGVTSTDNNTAADVSSVTIIGETGLEIITVNNTGGSNAQIASFWKATVPTGTSGTIAVQMSEATDNCAISVYRIINASTTVFDTASDIATPYTQSLDVPGFGAAVGLLTQDGNRTTTWTNLTEDLDVNGYDGTQPTTQSTASAIFSTQQSVSITATESGANNAALALVSFAPL